MRTLEARTTKGVFDVSSTEYNGRAELVVMMRYDQLRISDSGEIYNGWTNYETWAVGMFLDGNYTGEGTYREVLELARYRVDQALTLAEELREYVAQEVVGNDAPASLATDLLGAALAEVNWRELADAKLAEVAES